MKDFTEMLLYAGTAASGVLFLIFKFSNIRRMLAFDVIIDIAATTFLIIALSGTGNGIMIALIGGTIISITLWTLKQLLGTETLTCKGWQQTEKPITQLTRKFTGHKIDIKWKS